MAPIALERVEAWRVRAEEAVPDLSGRRPRRPVARLAARVAVSAPHAAEAGGVSISAAQRALALLVERGVAREIAGRGRFGKWSSRG